MISRGLLISVGITILAVGLVFVYFRNKVTGIEKKVELMFNLIQNYDGQQNAARGDFVSEPRMNQDETYHQPVEQTIKSELIQVSEDEDNSDSDEVSDSDEDSDEEEETLKFEPTNIELKDDEIKTINLDNLEEIKHEIEEDSLDEIDDDEDDDEEDGEEEEKEEIKPEPQEETEQTPQEESDDEPFESVEVIELTANDYKKKTVTELKKIASGRGLHNYRSLKKDPLIQLLMSQ